MDTPRHKDPKKQAPCEKQELTTQMVGHNHDQRARARFDILLGKHMQLVLLDCLIA